MRHSFLDRYRHGTSLIHRLDPRLKLLATLAFIVVVTGTPPQAWPVFIFLAGLAVGVVLAAEVPLVEGLRRSAVALPFAFMVAVSVPFTRAGNEVWTWQPFGASWALTITDEGLWLFMAVVVKSWLSVMVGGLLVATTPFSDLLAAMRSLRVPAVLLATISFMYRYLFVLVDEAMRLMTAREARSVGTGRTLAWRARVLGGMIGSLFIRSYERSERIYAAMLSRGFDVADGRVHTLTTFSWQGHDTWAATLWLAALSVLFALGRLLPRLLF